MTFSHQPFQSRVRVDAAGRILIPSEVRTKFGIESGQELILSEAVDGLRLRTFRQALTEAQDFFSAFVRPGESVVDELIRERREEAAQDERD